METLIIAFSLFHNSNDLTNFDIIQHHNLRYILLSKFQTDNLEGRYGLYKQHGCNYLVIVKDVMHSERKLKVKDCNVYLLFLKVYWQVVTL